MEVWPRVDDLSWFFGQNLIREVSPAPLISFLTDSLHSRQQLSKAKPLIFLWNACSRTDNLHLNPLDFQQCENFHKWFVFFSFMFDQQCLLECRGITKNISIFIIGCFIQMSCKLTWLSYNQRKAGKTDLHIIQIC